MNSLFDVTSSFVKYCASMFTRENMKDLKESKDLLILHGLELFKKMLLP